MTDEDYNSPYTIVDNIPVPDPGPNQILVRITASSLCMSDVMGIRGYTNSPLPYCGGHEPVGLVEQVGPGVCGFKSGDRVGFMPASRTCQDCAACLSGNHRYCAEKVSVGFSGRYGGFSQYCLSDPLSTVKVPDGLSDQDAAPLFCAGVTAYGAVKKAARRQVGGSLVNIVGSGGVGHLAIMYAKAMGFRVHAFDVAADKLDLALQSGADAAFNSATTDLANVEKAASTIVISGAIKAYSFAMKITNTCGAVIAVGAPHEPFPCNVTEMVLSELSLIATNQGTKQELSEAVALAAEKGIKPVTQTWHIDDINAAMDDMLAGKVAGRIVFRMW
ncbi:alcohol dehydrogenase [Grosmannia clavigera kw1407]|uniref:Alcohol dehydrogenase n=1 Tax=Grosmannia clavigera (strain kw1407 / UAMH 11150) TaxID=655863 RepID=F0XNL3_GROCL|nr:alcohol dehydrogenase [Grosmannia clavigera kw1407]EFX00622.1 alcohol dehydrogenase [Grosmannia clavigera kw1407]